MESLLDMDLNTLYKVYKNLHIMLEARGYTPQDEMLPKKKYIDDLLLLMLNDDMEPFQFLNELVLFFNQEMENGESNLLMVYFHILDTKFKKEDMEYIHKKTIDYGSNQLLIIVKDKVTPRVSTILDVLGPEVQLFCLEELIIDVPTHQLVPIHQLMTLDEKQKLLTFYKLKESDVPTIFISDPIVKYYNWRLGDCIRIVRKDDTGTHYSYRIVKTPTGNQA